VATVAAITIGTVVATPDKRPTGALKRAARITIVRIDLAFTFDSIETGRNAAGLGRRPSTSATRN
jgi:hypothetical protein